MAISANHLTAGTNNTGTSTAVTGTITPSANALVLFSVSSRATANPPDPTITGNGLTWAEVGSSLYDSGGSSRRRLVLYRSMGASPTSTPGTISFGTFVQTDICWSIDEFTGVDTTGANGAGAIVQAIHNEVTVADGNSLIGTLAAFSSTDNSTYGCFGHAVNVTGMTVGAGFTQLASVTSGTQNTLFAEWKVANDTTVDMSWTTNSERGVVAVEIKAAPVVGTMTASNILSGSSNANGPWTTGTFGVSANQLVLLGVSIRNGASTAPTVATVTGLGLTWERGTAMEYDNSGASRRSMEVWRTMASGTVSGSVVITNGETDTGAVWNIDSITGADTSGANGSGAIVQGVVGSVIAATGSTVIGTLGAFSSTNNATYGYFSNEVGTATTTAGSGFTKKGDVQGADANISISAASEFFAGNDTTVDLTWSGGAQPSLGVAAFEIKAAAVAGATIFPNWKSLLGVGY